MTQPGGFQAACLRMLTPKCSLVSGAACGQARCLIGLSHHAFLPLDLLSPPQDHQEGPVGHHCWHAQPLGSLPSYPPPISPIALIPHRHLSFHRLCSVTKLKPLHPELIHPGTHSRYGYTLKNSGLSVTKNTICVSEQTGLFSWASRFGESGHTLE